MVFRAATNNTIQLCGLRQLSLEGLFLNTSNHIDGIEVMENRALETA